MKLIGFLAVLLSLAACGPSDQELITAKRCYKAFSLSYEESQDQAELTLKRIEKVVRDGGSKPQQEAILTEAQQQHKLFARLYERLEGKINTFLQSGASEYFNDFSDVKIDVSLTSPWVDSLIPLLSEIQTWIRAKGKLTGYAKFPRGYLLYDSVTKELKINMPTGNIPLYAGLMNLRGTQVELCALEQDLLNEYQRKVPNGIGIRQDIDTKVYIKAEEEYIEEGQSYKAQIMYLHYTKAMEFITGMRVNGKEIPIRDGVGEFTIQPKALHFDVEGLAEQTFTTEICVRYYGLDTVFTNQEKFYIRKKCTP